MSKLDSLRYVGKYIANLTLAQLKTLDCGSERLSDFRMYCLMRDDIRVILTHTN